MADVRQRVLDAADGVAQSLTYQIGRLEGELQEKQVELDVINRKLRAASDAATRRKIFVVASGAEYYCPQCFIRDQAKSVLALKPGSSPDGIIECDACGLSI